MKQTQDQQQTREQQTREQWAAEQEALWKRARELAAKHPEHDVTDLFHALKFRKLTPAERLAIGLRHGRLRRPHKG